MRNGILSTVGHTPLVELNKLYPTCGINLYAKLEMFNPGGSIKDRAALFILSKALKKGKLEKNATIIESSSGNMAIGLAQACRYLNLSLIVVVDPKINRHTKKILHAYGAQIDMVTSADDSGNYLTERLNRVKELLNIIPGSYWPNQYANKHNPAAHFQTMKEIVHDAPELPDYLLAATSTCGTLMGCADFIKQNELHTQIVAVDAVGSVIFSSHAADRLVPGHGAGRPSELLDKEAVDQVVHITDEECIIGCHRLLEREAILAGGSSGAVVMALEKMQPAIPEGATCALIFPDSGERYLETIFNDRWVADHFGEEAQNKINEVAVNPESEINFRSSNGTPGAKKASLEGAEKPSATTKIAIIGGGPKGMFGFERLAAQFDAHPAKGPVEIHIFNKTSHFGAGEVYRPGQPSYLLMNNPAGDINMWIAEDPSAVVSEPLSLVEWVQRKEGKKVSQKKHLSRGTVGRYLMQGFEKIAAHLPGGVKGQYIIGEVINIIDDNSSLRLELKMANGKTQKMNHRYDHVLLATGHPRNQPTQEDENFEQFVQEREYTGFVPFIYPVEGVLTNIPAGSKVAIKGVGLTFVDAALSLTEGKGGTFVKDNNTLSYRRSGDEPEAIYAFSRSGLPMIPRGPAPECEGPLLFFTESILSDLTNRHHNRKLDFKTEILPLLNREMKAAFYNIKLREAGFKDDLLACESFIEVQHHIAAFHKQNSSAETFDLSNFLNPLNTTQITSGSVFNKFIRDYLTFWLKQTKMGEQKSPWAAVTAVWRKATPLFGKYYAFGGLNPQSQYYFDTQFRPKLNRVTFGPPAESAEKLLALMDAGILYFDFAQNPTIQTDKTNGSFSLRIDDYNIRQAVHFLVDARISKVSLTDDRSPLYQNLLNNGLISRYSNGSGKQAYQPGCMAISADGFAIDKKGEVNNKIAATGTPTEGITFDNDALSRRRNNFVSKWAAHIQECSHKSRMDTYVLG